MDANYPVLKHHAANRGSPEEKSMKKFATIALLALFAAGPALAQSNAGSNSSGAMSNSTSSSMSHGSGAMTGSMSDHDKMAKHGKKKGAMTGGAMSDSMTSGAKA